jgi:hypothetical protein
MVRIVLPPQRAKWRLVRAHDEPRHKLSSARRYPFEKVLITKDQASIIDLKVSLETCRDPEVHVAYPIRAEAVVSLT